MKILMSLTFLFLPQLALSSLYKAAELCPERLVESIDEVSVEYVCDERGFLKTKTTIVTGKIHTEERFADGLLVRRVRTREGQGTSIEIREYNSSIPAITVTKKKITADGKQIIKARKKLRYVPGVSFSSRSHLLQNWKFEKSGLLKSSTKYDFGDQLITAVLRYDETGAFDSSLAYTYSDKSIEEFKKGMTVFPETFTEKDASGVVTASYDSLVLPKHMGENNGPFISVAAMDSGIDPNHESLSHKLDVRNGSYGKGIIHPEGLPNHILDLAASKKKDLVAHGLHVSSIMLEGHENVKLTSFAVLPPASYYRTRSSIEVNKMVENFFKSTSNEIKKRKVQFVNASLGIDLIFNGPPPEVAKGLRVYRTFEKSMTEVIENNPETLFVVSAGNGDFGGGVNADDPNDWPAKNGKLFPPTPAHLTAANLLVVGALNTGTLDENLMHTYKLTGFSNYGEKSVDIFAPGENVPGAMIGGGSIPMSGTSMASPYALNHGVLNVYKANRKLSNAQIKEVIIKTAYIKDINKPLPALSGGILYPSRAVLVAKMLTNDSQLTIEKAALDSRKQISHVGESADVSYLKKLEVFWRAKGI